MSQDDNDSVWDEVQTKPVAAPFFPLGDHESGDVIVLQMLEAFSKAEQSKHAPVEALVVECSSETRFVLAPSSKHLLSDLAKIDPEEGDRIRLELQQTGDGAMNRVWSADLDDG